MSENSRNREELLRGLEVENRKSTMHSVLLLQAVTQRSGMNLTDLRAINILTSTGPIDAGRLAEEMGLTTGAVTGVINRMERMGYARREKDPDDGRRVVIQPVPEELERVGADVFGLYENDMALGALVSEYDDRVLAALLDLMREANDMTEEGIARIWAASKGDDEGELATPLGSVKSGRLILANGASRLTLRAGTGMDDLYRARFEGAPPKAAVEAGTVTFRRSRRFTLFDSRRHSEEVTLNASVPWEIEVRGGAAQIEADLTRLALSSFVLKGGVSELDLTLPEPSGVIPVRLLGGASKVRIHRPTGVEARLNVRGGAATLTFDEQHFDAVGGKIRLQSPGYDGTSDRYEIEVSGGASEIAVR